jgi:hypothetical protein
MINYYENSAKKEVKLKELSERLHKKLETFFIGSEMKVDINYHNKRGLSLNIWDRARKTNSIQLTDKKVDDGLDFLREGIENRNEFEKILGASSMFTWNTIYSEIEKCWHSYETFFYKRTQYCDLKEINERIKLIVNRNLEAGKKIEKKKKMMELYNSEIKGSPLSEEIEKEIEKIIPIYREELNSTLLLMDELINKYVNVSMEEARKIMSE